MDPVPHEDDLACASHIDETPETVRHPPGDTGEPRVVARQRQAAGVSQSRAGLDIHHELVIYCFN